MTSSRLHSPWLDLLAQITDHWPPKRWLDVGVVIGCSGGADSTALTLALARLRQESANVSGARASGFLVIAHFNHGLRAAASDGDQRFSSELASRLGIEFECGRALGDEKPADEATMSRQRMDFLIETAKRRGARYVTLGHSLDDNVETLLHHLMRGTGPSGLAGIGSPRSIDADLVLIRPMLASSRASIRQALIERGESWREDASNEDTGYGRNWIRHELVPLMESRYPDAVAAIGRTIGGQKEWRTLVDSFAKRWLETYRDHDEPTTLRRDPQADRASLISAAQILWTQQGWPRRDMSREHWLRVAASLAGKEDEKYMLPGGIEVVARGECVKFRDG